MAMFDTFFYNNRQQVETRQRKVSSLCQNHPWNFWNPRKQIRFTGLRVDRVLGPGGTFGDNVISDNLPCTWDLASVGLWYHTGNWASRRGCVRRPARLRAFIVSLGTWGYNCVCFCAALEIAVSRHWIHVSTQSAIQRQLRADKNLSGVWALCQGPGVQE